MRSDESKRLMEQPSAGTADGRPRPKPHDPTRAEPDAAATASTTTTEQLPASPHSVTSPFDQPTPANGMALTPKPGQATPSDVDADQRAELLDSHQAERFRGRLRELQADFVDDPERAVREAQQLVGEAMQALTDALAERRRVLGVEAPAGGTWRTVYGSETPRNVQLKTID